MKHKEDLKTELKIKLFNKCVDIQTNSVDVARKAMNEAQESANEEKGSMEEKFDSFRESMHITRDMFARQFNEGMNSLTLLKRINPNLIQTSVAPGSLVYTDLQNYFISISLGEIEIDNEKFMTVSTLTPIFQALSGKKAGESFEFRNKTYQISKVY